MIVHLPEDNTSQNFTSFSNIRVFLALADDPKDRGTIVAQGGGKVKKEICSLGSNAAK